MGAMRVDFVQFNRQLRNMREWFYHYEKKLPKKERLTLESVKKINECLLTAGFEILNLVDYESKVKSRQLKVKRRVSDGTI
jgi:hypothetical protein